MLNRGRYLIWKRIFLFFILMAFAACKTTPVKEAKNESIKPAASALEKPKEKRADTKKPVEVSTIQEAVRIMALNLSAGLPPHVKSVAVLPPGDMSGYPNKAFESRVSDGLTNRLKPLLPQGCRLVERAKIKKIFKDSIVYGDDDLTNTLLEEAGVEINIVGSYTILKTRDQVELSYRAVSVKNGDILATSPTVFIPASVLKDTGSAIMLITRGKGMTRAQGGAEVLAKVSRTMKQALSSKGITIIDDGGTGGDDPFYAATREGARLLVLLEVEGKKEYTNFGNIKGSVSVTAKIYKIPEQEIIFTKSEKKQVLAVSEDESPLLRGVDFVMEKIAPQVTDSLKNE